MRYFFNIRGLLDEHTRNAINEAVVHAFIFLWLYIFIATEAMVTFSNSANLTSMMNIFVYANLFIGVGGTNIFIRQTVSKLHLDIQEVSESDYSHAVSDAVKSSMISGLLWGLIFLTVLMTSNVMKTQLIILSALGFFLLVWIIDSWTAISHIVKVK